MLPGEGVDDRHHRVAALGQRAAARREGERGLAQGGCGLWAASVAEAGGDMFAVQPKGMLARKGATPILDVMEPSADVGYTRHTQPL